MHLSILRIYNKTVNCNKQVHPDLDASLSTYSILAHGIPRSFNVNVAASKIAIATDNNFVLNKIFRMHWLGGSRDPMDPRQPGTVVIALTDPNVSDLLVKQCGLFLSGCFHRSKHSNKLLLQCFKCLQMVPGGPQIWQVRQQKQNLGMPGHNNFGWQAICDMQGCQEGEGELGKCVDNHTPPPLGILSFQGNRLLRGGEESLPLWRGRQEDMPANHEPYILGS
jgi:hypothetical protein